ncbi:UNVERIFIED_CONTAM: hypothetical protein Sradi_2101700 [Sesamum radiatum]|uniref:Uncharacterized protein n=1 Tax=Sesamum radiatum TaxID=300843 RepID=A0AAW2TIV3_SESRA
MELESNHDQEQKQKQTPVSVLQGDGYCISRILARESSVGQSSRIFYRSAEGVPFKWEMQPGTPKNPQEQDVIPPLCPSPLMQSLGLPLPNLDHDEVKETTVKTSRIWSLKKMVKKSINLDLRRSKQHESSRFGDSGGEFVGSAENSSFSSDASSSSFLDSSTVDGPFCCSPWNVPVILFSGPLNSEVTPAGVPFRWEMQPGTPKTTPEDDLIPPPSPPPAVQSLALPQPRLHVAGEPSNDSAWKRAWIWMKRNYRGKKSEKMQREISFRYNEKRELCSSNEELDAYFRRSASVSSLSSVAPLSKEGWRVSRIRRSFQGGYSSCGPWSRKDILVFVRRKLKSVITS